MKERMKSCRKTASSVKNPGLDEILKNVKIYRMSRRRASKKEPRK